MTFANVYAFTSIFINDDYEVPIKTHIQPLTTDPVRIITSQCTDLESAITIQNAGLNDNRFWTFSSPQQILNYSKTEPASQKTGYGGKVVLGVYPGQG